MPALATAKQDTFTMEEVAKMIKDGLLSRGQYVFDISEDGKVKVSLMKKRWIQREDVEL
jgi:hypothetical protein